MGFAPLTIVVVLIDQKNWLINRLVDVMVCSLCLLSLLLVSDAVFGQVRAVWKDSGKHWERPRLLVCLVALTIAVALRQAERGVFSIFLGVGIGSGLARVFAPILLLLPFAWEAVNAWMNRAGPAGHLDAALIASIAVSQWRLGILLFFAWRISSMENEIHDLDSARRSDAALQHQGLSHAGRTRAAAGATIEGSILGAFHRSRKSCARSIRNLGRMRRRRRWRRRDRFCAQRSVSRTSRAGSARTSLPWRGNLIVPAFRLRRCALKPRRPRAARRAQASSLLNSAWGT